MTNSHWSFSNDFFVKFSLLNLFKKNNKKTHTFCGFSMGRNQYWAGRVYDLCVYYMTGTPKGSTDSGFMEKPGIEPATPGLQGIALIHYTTGIHWSFPINFFGKYFSKKFFVKFFKSSVFFK